MRGSLSQAAGASRPASLTDHPFTLSARSSAETRELGAQACSRGQMSALRAWKPSDISVWVVPAKRGGGFAVAGGLSAVDGEGAACHTRSAAGVGETLADAGKLPADVGEAFAGAGGLAA